MSEYFSEEGLEKLKQELEDLKTAKRHEIAARLEHAKSLGDLSENAEYQEAKEEQSLLDCRDRGDIAKRRHHKKRRVFESCPGRLDCSRDIRTRGGKFHHRRV